jgi:CheY-like chemotaxis protein
LDLLQKKIILIEGKQTDHPSFFLNLQKKGYNVEIASTGNAALDKIREDRPMLVLIDAASLRTTCNRIVYRIKQRNPDLPVILIIDDMLKNRKISNKCDLVMTLPFTVQKLVNRIKLFAPSNSDCIRNVGDITLDKSKRSISVDNRYTLVTPRVVKLLEVWFRAKIFSAKSGTPITLTTCAHWMCTCSGCARPLKLIPKTHRLSPPSVESDTVSTTTKSKPDLKIFRDMSLFKYSQAPKPV